MVRTNKAPEIEKDTIEKKEFTEVSADRAKLENDTLEAGSGTKEDETLEEDKTSPLGIATEEVVPTDDTTDTGEEISANEIKYSLEELCANEDKKKPLSDQKLTDLLNQKGFNVARRTVAKYREQLNLEAARLRRQL